MLRLILKKRGLSLLIGAMISLLSISEAKAQITITTQPIGKSAVEGQYITSANGGGSGVGTISVTAIGGGTGANSKRYIWYRYKAGGADTIRLSSVNTPPTSASYSYQDTTSFALIPLQLADSGYYYFCKIYSNGLIGDTVRSNSCMVSVTAATAMPLKPDIKYGSTVLASDANLIIGSGSNVTFTATWLAGTPLPSTIKWYKNDVEYSGASWGTASPIGSKLSFTLIKMTDTGYYYCTFKNEAGTVASNKFHIAVLSNTAKPTYTLVNSMPAPTDSTVIIYDTVFIGSTIDFLNVGGVNNTLSQQWYQGGSMTVGTGTVLANATSLIYKPLTGITPRAWAATDSGTYYCDLSNGGNPAMKIRSNPIHIAVVDGRGITANAPQGNTTVIEAVDTLVLTAAATGIKIYQNAYKWYHNGTLLGQTAATIKYPMVSLADTGTYTYKAFNEVDSSAMSEGVKVTITREDLPLFHNLQDKYPQATSNVDLRLKGVASETLTNWLIIKADNTTQVVTPYVDAQGKRFLQAAIGSKLGLGKYIVQVSNSDNTLTIQKVVEIY